MSDYSTRTMFIGGFLVVGAAAHATKSTNFQSLSFDLILTKILER